MIRIFKPYEGDKRTREYKEYLTQWSLKLGLLNKDKNVSEEPVLFEERTPEDYYKIIMYLDKLLPINDIVRNIVESVLMNEPLSNRTWYMNIYTILRESNLPKILMHWQVQNIPRFSTTHERVHIRDIFKNSMNLPDSTYRKVLMRNLRTKPVWLPRTMNVYSWINFDKEYEAVSWIDAPKDIDIYKDNNNDNDTKLYTPDQPTHYYRIVDNNFKEPPKKVHWTECGESWVKSVSYSVYTPYRIRWELCRDCKFSRDFIENNRKSHTLKRPHDYKLTPISPWIRIECGNRFYYKNKETGKKMREEPLEGFSNVNISDIYYFDRNVPVF
tara:strand:- start:520 stop:1503 length:984 start_codon:yes stop_codon:yes gene_type:complete